jgi:hypothetical protein
MLSITLQNFHLKVETTAAESTYESIAGKLSSSGRKARAGRALTVLYDVGIVASLLGMALGTVLLAINASSIVWRLMLSVPLDAIMMSMDQFSKRSLGETTPSASPSMELYAIVSCFPFPLICVLTPALDTRCNRTMVAFSSHHHHVVRSSNSPRSRSFRLCSSVCFNF